MPQLAMPELDVPRIAVPNEKGEYLSPCGDVFLSPYKTPECYMGETYHGLLVCHIAGQNRDSDSLTRSNHTCILDILGKIAEESEETWLCTRASHWACGWIETVYISPTWHAGIQKLASIAEDLESYPVVNEDHWGDLEYTEAHEFWAGLSVEERLSYIQDYNERAGEHTISIFAARRDYQPETYSGEYLVDPNR